MDSQTLEKYAPYLAVGAVAIVGVYLYSKGSGVSQGTSYTTVQPDNSAAQNASVQLAQQNLAARAQGFLGILDYAKTDLLSKATLESEKMNHANQQALANTQLQISLADQATQRMAIQTSGKVAKHNSNNQLIGSVIGGVITAAMLFCYRTTEIAQANYQTYTHGRVAV